MGLEESLETPDESATETLEEISIWMPGVWPAMKSWDSDQSEWIRARVGGRSQQANANEIQHRPTGGSSSFSDGGGGSDGDDTVSSSSSARFFSLKVFNGY